MPSSCNRRALTGMRGASTIPGIGALNATALVAAIGDGSTFARGRDLAAWLGLVPRQVTTGGRTAATRASRSAGSKYLRKMLIQGARSAMPALRESDTRLGEVAAWAAVAGACQHGRRCARGQNGAHRLGAAASSTCLRRRLAAA